VDPEELDMITRTALAAIATAALTLPFGVVAPAVASHGGGDDDVRTRGGCSGSAHWKLKAKPDDGRIEVEGEVDSNSSGQVWTWKLKHNGSVSARGTKLTGGTSGSFEVGRRMANLAGQDHFVFRAEHRGQVCRGTISY
jgi:hypothetical protein